jgi:hypothetical protein
MMSAGLLPGIRLALSGEDWQLYAELNIQFLRDLMGVGM